MSETVNGQNAALNRIWKRMNMQYHDYAVACGLSDPAMWTLYALYENRGEAHPLTQNDIVETWMYPKQTVNFTITGLAKKGYVCLEQLGGARNSKAIHLTEAGKQLCEKTIRPLMEAEENALRQLTEQERALLVRLNEAQCSALEHEIQKMI